MGNTAVAAMSGVPVPLFTPAADSEATVSAIVAPPMSFRHHSFIIKPDADISAGAVQPETTDDIDDPNTWAPVGGGPVDVSAPGVDVIIELFGIYRFLRLSVTTPIADGTVSADYYGGKNF